MNRSMRGTAQRRRKPAAGLASAACAVFLAMILMIPMAATCFAADGYGFTIRVSSGGQGTFADGTTEWVRTVDAGAAVTLDLDAMNVVVTDDAYYAKGLRLAGHDDGDNTIVRSLTVSNVQEDLSYVVVYGVRSSLVKYTVQYLDQDGNVLLPEATFYGAVGDKPVVSFRYVEGYAPTAYNETRTLTSDSESNVFTFRYYKTDVAAETESTSTDADNGAGNDTDQNATDNNAGAADGNQPGVNNGNNNAANPGVNNAANNNAANNNPAAVFNTEGQTAALEENTPGTPNMVNLDDQDVPLAAPDETLAGKDSGNALITRIILFACIAAGLAMIFIAVFFYRRRHSQMGEIEEIEE